MTQEERRIYLIEELLKEGKYNEQIPQDEQGQKDLLRSLMNVRGPFPVSDEFLKVQVLPSCSMAIRLIQALSSLRYQPPS